MEEAQAANISNVRSTACFEAMNLSNWPRMYSADLSRLPRTLFELKYRLTAGPIGDMNFMDCVMAAPPSRRLLAEVKQHRAGPQRLDGDKRRYSRRFCVQGGPRLS